MSTGRRSNVEHLQSTGRFHIVEQDIEEEIPSSLPGFDEIYNLACPASPIHYQADPVKTALTSAMGAWNVLNRANKDGSRAFQASTSEIYGDPDVHPQKEVYNGNVNSVGPRSCYDEGKRFAETLFTDFGKSRNLIVRIARIFNTYGPRMHPDDGRVVSNFIVQALRGENITIYGDGTQTRSFCYVDDLIDGFDALMHSQETISGPINIGNPVELQVGELAETILGLTGSKSKIIRLPLPVDDPRRRRPDISQAKAILDWEPKIDLREGLISTIRYFDEELSKSPPHSSSLVA